MATPPIRPSHVLNVTPLNSIPYIDPVGTNNNSNSIHQGADNGLADPVHPSLLYLPYQPTEEELNKVLSVTNNGVMLGGSATKGLIGPVIGKLDIGEDDTSYIFRVGLPGVAREEFSCDVAPDGQILIRGVTTTGEKAVYKDSMKFDMLTQNLCPPGHFSISFKLPGAVDSQQLDAVLGIDGVFEVGTNNNSNSIHQAADNGLTDPVHPSLLYLPYQPTEEELNKVLSVTNNGVMLGGSATNGLIGPVIGKLDIGEDDTSYIFRVGLPGVAREEFSCDVAPDGQILIRGVTTTGEKAVYKDSMKFDMLTQNLCPPGHFSISFKLPGAVDSQQLDAVLGIDGVFEGIVKKNKSMN